MVSQSFLNEAHLKDRPIYMFLGAILLIKLLINNFINFNIIYNNSLLSYFIQISYANGTQKRF